MKQGEHPCPRCPGETLIPTLDKATAFLRCGRCHGLFFAAELDLERYTSVARGPAAGRVFARLLFQSLSGDKVQRNSKRKCPLCAAPLRFHPLGDETHFYVLLDRCERHGFWLDRAELTTILDGCQRLAQG